MPVLLSGRPRISISREQTRILQLNLAKTSIPSCTHGKSLQTIDRTMLNRLIPPPPSPLSTVSHCASCS